MWQLPLTERKVPQLFFLISMRLHSLHSFN
jgi:hypothetical protein